MRKLIWTFLFLFTAAYLSAQVKIHKVASQETIYGISKQYGITQDELIEANPILKERGLQIDDELNIPQKSDGQIKTVVTSSEQPAPPTQETTITEIPEPDDDMVQSDDDFIYLKIESGQTIYSITKEYGISENALKSLNPQLAQGLKAGDIIRIPKKKTKNTKEPGTPEGMHKVKKGETVYTLSNQFGVTEDQFYIANPIVQIDGLKEGAYIRIPKKNVSADAVIKGGFVEEKITEGETIFNLSKKFGVTLDQLLEHNPGLSNGLKAGMTLKIPLSGKANIIKVANVKRVDDNEVNLALILPFYLDKSGHSQEKNVSSDFLVGAKTALGLLAKRGKNINLQVFDSDSSGATIEGWMSTEDFSKFDAIIGPLFARDFKAAAEFLEDTGIALVSPISNSDDLKGLKNVIIANPNDKAVADAIIGEVRNNYGGQQIQILTDDRNEDLAKYVRDELMKKLGNSDIFVTKDIDKLVQKSETVTEKLDDETTVEQTYYTPVITMLVSESNSLGDAYVKKITEMDADNVFGFGVKFVNAYDVYSTKNKENYEALRNMGFIFGTSRLINVYGAFEREVLTDFVDTYCVNPNEYRQIGFDVIFDLVDRMNKSGDVLNALGGSHTRLATKFEYEKEGETYINKGIRIVRLLKKGTPSEIEEGMKD